MAVVTIVFLGIAGMTGCASSEKLLIQKNWEMKLPDGGTEDSYAEFAEKYFRQGLKVVITGRIQTGSYTNRDGNKVYTTDVVVEDQEFAESKAAAQRNREESSQERMEPMPVDENGFMTLPEDFDEELPFA